MEERRAVLCLTQTPRMAKSLPPDPQEVTHRPSHVLCWYLSRGVTEIMKPLRETCKKDRFQSRGAYKTKCEPVTSTSRKAYIHWKRKHQQQL